MWSQIIGKAHWFNVISRVNNILKNLFLSPEYSHFCVLIAIQLLATRELGITVLNKIESMKENSQDKLMQTLRWWYSDTA